MHAQPASRTDTEGGTPVFRYALLMMPNGTRLIFSKYMDNEHNPEPMLSGQMTRTSLRVHKYGDKLANVAQVVPAESSIFSNPTAYAVEVAKNVDIIGIVAMTLASEKTKGGVVTEGLGCSHSH